MIQNKPKVLGCDLDGTLLEHAVYPKFGKPIDGMREVLHALRKLGYKVAVWTCRNESEYPGIREHLARHNIEIDYINENPHEGPSTSPKIYCDVYLDDRGLRFMGDTSGLLEAIVNHRPWHKIV